VAIVSHTSKTINHAPLLVCDKTSKKVTGKGQVFLGRTPNVWVMSFEWPLGDNGRRGEMKNLHAVSFLDYVNEFLLDNEAVFAFLAFCFYSDKYIVKIYLCQRFKKWTVLFEFAIYLLIRLNRFLAANLISNAFVRVARSFCTHHVN